jgi:hypothetical protein
VIPSPSLCSALVATVDRRRATGGGAFSLSRARRPVDPPLSSSKADGSSGQDLFLSGSGPARPPQAAAPSQLTRISTANSEVRMPPLSRAARDFPFGLLAFASSSSSIEAEAA